MKEMYKEAIYKEVGVSYETRKAIEDRLDRAMENNPDSFKYDVDYFDAEEDLVNKAQNAINNHALSESARKEKQLIENRKRIKDRNMAIGAIGGSALGLAPAIIAKKKYPGNILGGALPMTGLFGGMVVGDYLGDKRFRKKTNYDNEMSKVKGSNSAVDKDVINMINTTSDKDIIGKRASLYKEEIYKTANEITSLNEEPIVTQKTVLRDDIKAAIDERVREVLESNTGEDGAFDEYLEQAPQEQVQEMPQEQEQVQEAPQEQVQEMPQEEMPQEVPQEEMPQEEVENLPPQIDPLQNAKAMQFQQQPSDPETEIVNELINEEVDEAIQEYISGRMEKKKQDAVIEEEDMETEEEDKEDDDHKEMIEKYKNQIYKSARIIK